jgi:tRNA uridine 5-carbamoylmethylation protein Kti12
MSNQCNRILIITTGIPCAGKSFLTSLLQSKYKDTHAILKIERDEIFQHVIDANPGVGNNKKNKLITEKMNEIYTQFNTHLSNAILIVDSCSGNDGVRKFIMDKANGKTKTIIVNIQPKTSHDELDIDFYITRAQQRPPHYVFPRDLDAQIKELHKCYGQYSSPQESNTYDVISLMYDWTSDVALSLIEKHII